MKLFGIIGYPLEHSHSEKYFRERNIKENNLQNVAYKKFPLKGIEEFPLLIRQNEELSGLNVTIPYKERILKYVDSLDETAQKIGAVNTLTIETKDGQPFIKGYNTDAPAFKETIEPHLADHHKKALILGTGGAAKAVAYALETLDIGYTFVSRNPRSGILSYRVLNEYIIETHHIIINTTPIGMFPDNASCPEIPYKKLSSKHLLYDLVYNPPKTEFLINGTVNHAKTIGGLDMFRLQAEKTWKLWNLK